LASLRCDTFRREAIDINSKESIKLLQVYLKAHRSDAASEALRLCLVKGVPLWMLRNNEITKTIFTNDTFKPILTHYDSFRNVYFQSIETQAKRRIDSLFAIDQILTQRLNQSNLLQRPVSFFKWKKFNRRNIQYLKTWIESSHYWGEKFIGLPDYYQDSASAWKEYSQFGPVPEVRRLFFMLLHIYSHRSQPSIQNLYQQVLVGNMEALQYASVCDFMAEFGSGNESNPGRYNVWHKNSESRYQDEISNRRSALGLPAEREQSFFDSLNRVIRRERKFSEILY